jgi:hypothetical protein
MKKYKWLIAGIVALILATTIVVFNVSAKPSHHADCAEDGSCCEDESSCNC